LSKDKDFQPVESHVLSFFATQPLAFDLQPFRIMISASEGSHVPAEQAQYFQLGDWIVRVGNCLSHGHRNSGDETNGQLIPEIASGRLLQFRGILTESPYRIHGILLEQPIAISARFPMGQIRFIDRPALKLRRENRLGLRQRINPLDGLPGLLAIVNTLIDLFPKVMRQSRNFSNSAHKKFLFLNLV
jgi:hypothetical protein